jgi:hypothetical protein
MMTRPLVRSMGVLAVSAVLLAACGGGGSSSSGSSSSVPESPPSSTSSGTVEAKTWATNVCQSTLDWVNAVQEKGQSFGSIAGGAGSLDEAKTAFVSFFDSMITQTQTFLDQLQSAGTPDVEGGDQIVSSLTTGIQEVEDGFKDAKTKAEALPTDDPTAFTTQVTAIGTDMTTAFDRIGNTFSALQNSELDQQAQDIPACQQLQAAGSSTP